MALYDFIDVTEVPSGASLPAEAMSYNGIYIENEITGYRTLYVSGRELLVSELQTGEITGIDGARYLGRRRPVRTLKVRYQLIADTASEFREKFNKLNSLLRGEQVPIIFADEPDKYFIGTKTSNSEIEPGTNSVIGEIEITCTNPYKYGTTLKGFTAGLPESDATVTLEPVQEGMGDPSPSNIREISGHKWVDIVADGITYTVAFPVSAGTVYGGTLDLSTGTLTVTWAYHQINPDYVSSATIIGNNVRSGIYSLNHGEPAATGANADAISNYLPKVTANYNRDETGFYFYNGTSLYIKIPKSEITFLDEEDAVQRRDDLRAYLTDHPLDIVYEMAEPVTYQLTGSDNGFITLNVNNEGTEPCSILYEVTHTADNGFIGIVSDHGIMQFGNPEEVDGEDFQGNELLSSLEDWPASRVTGSVMHPAYNYQGTIKKATVDGVTGLMIDSFGTRQDSTWNGACQELTLPADSTGAYGAVNFYCWTRHWFETGVLGQTGEQGIAFLTSDNKFICGMQIVKSDAVGNSAYAEFFVNGKIKRQIAFTPSYRDDQNPYNSRGANDIRKEGNKVTFYWWGQHFSYVDPEIENLVCTKIQVTFDNYGQRESYVSRNMIREIRFEKMGVDGWRDVPNRYAAGDVVTIDGSSSKVYVNGMHRPDDEVIGTRYFKAEPGINEIKVVVSEWCRTAPAVKAYIREVWQ